MTGACCATARCVPRATGLVKALPAQALLNRSGWPAVVWIGVAKDPRRGFQAQAWVESQGRVVLGGTPGCEFIRLLRLG